MTDKMTDIFALLGLDATTVVDECRYMPETTNTEPSTREALAAALYRLEWEADLYATPRNHVADRYERRADRLLSSAALEAIIAGALDEAAAQVEASAWCHCKDAYCGHRAAIANAARIIREARP